MAKKKNTSWVCDQIAISPPYCSILFNYRASCKIPGATNHERCRSLFRAIFLIDVIKFSCSTGLRHYFIVSQTYCAHSPREHRLAPVHLFDCRRRSLCEQAHQLITMPGNLSWAMANSVDSRWRRNLLPSGSTMPNSYSKPRRASVCIRRIFIIRARLLRRARQDCYCSLLTDTSRV